MTMTTRLFSEKTQNDAISVVNSYFAGWPYARPLDRKILENWRHLDRDGTQPEHMLLAYRDGLPSAFLHGQRTGSDEHRIVLLAVKPGCVEDAVALLAQLEESSRGDGVTHIYGPGRWTDRFYCAYLVESEHPHWAIEGTEAYMRAGFDLILPKVLMVREMTPDEKVIVDPLPEGYEYVPQIVSEGPDHITLRYYVDFGGEEVGHCLASLSPLVIGPTGGRVGHLRAVEVSESHRNKGLARILAQACLRELHERGVTDALVSTGLRHLPAVKAYEGAGFRRRHYLFAWMKELAPKESGEDDVLF